MNKSTIKITEVDRKEYHIDQRGSDESLLRNSVIYECNGSFSHCLYNTKNNNDGMYTLEDWKFLHEVSKKIVEMYG